jgi:hypothetical protein
MVSSPFPGMDPFLEINPRWEVFPGWFIRELARQSVVQARELGNSECDWVFSSSRSSPPGERSSTDGATAITTSSVPPQPQPVADGQPYAAMGLLRRNIHDDRILRFPLISAVTPSERRRTMIWWQWDDWQMKIDHAPTTRISNPNRTSPSTRTHPCRFTTGHACLRERGMPFISAGCRSFKSH